MTQKTIRLFIAVSEAGDFQVSEESSTDAILELDCNYGLEAVRVVAIDMTLDLPTVEAIEITVPAETKAPVQITVSAPCDGRVGSEITAQELEDRINASKGGNIPGVTEDHRHEMMQQLQALRSQGR